MVWYGTAQYLSSYCAVSSVEGMKSPLRGSMISLVSCSQFLGGELGGPDHVHAEHVALAGLGAQALDQLRALLVGRLRQLDQLHGDVRVLLLEQVDRRAVGAARVLADAPGDVALGLARISRRSLRCVAAAFVVVVAAAGHRQAERATKDCNPDPDPHVNPPPALLSCGWTTPGATHRNESRPAVRALVKLEQVLPSHLRRRVRFVYRRRDGAESRREVEGYSLVNLGSRWYLLGWDCGREDWRTFRLDRLAKPAPTGMRFVPRDLPSKDVAAYVAQRLSSAPNRYEARVRDPRLTAIAL